MAQTKRGIEYNTDYDSEADVLEDMKKLAESVDLAIDDAVEEEKQSSGQTYSLINETGNKVDLELDENTFKIKVKLYDKNNNLISTSKEIDLPLESVVVDAAYDSEKKEIVLTLQNGNTVSFSVEDLITGLVNEDDFNEEIEKLQSENEKLKTKVTDLEYAVDNEKEKQKEGLKGLKWGIIGDSLNSHTILGSDKRLFYDYIAEKCGMTIAEYAVAGTGYMTGDRKFSVQANNVEEDCDLITVFGSFNDWNNAYNAVGKLGDTTTDTLYGSVYVTINNILEKAPDAKVGVILPTPWGAYNNINATDYAKNTKIPQFLNAIKETAQYLGIPVLDMYHNSQLRPWDGDFLTKWFKDYATTDKTHPNTEAHEKYLAPAIEQFIRGICNIY